MSIKQKLGHLSRFLVMIGADRRFGCNAAPWLKREKTSRRRSGCCGMSCKPGRLCQKPIPAALGSFVI